MELDPSPECFCKHFRLPILLFNIMMDKISSNHSAASPSINSSIVIFGETSDPCLLSNVPHLKHEKIYGNYTVNFFYYSELFCNNYKISPEEGYMLCLKQLFATNSK